MQINVYANHPTLAFRVCSPLLPGQDNETPSDRTS
jgi:hypothetical protein